MVKIQIRKILFIFMMVLKKIGYEISTEVLDLLFIRTIPWNYRGVNIVSLSVSFFLQIILT